MSRYLHFLAALVVAGSLMALLRAGEAWGQPRPSSNTTEPILPPCGLRVEQIAKDWLSDCEVKQRRLSTVGLGYHYLCQGSLGKVGLTIGVFATAEEARAAAGLSHGLMPHKPNLDSGIGDQTWVWQDKQGNAVRFRLGRYLLRVGGTVPLAESRALAQHIAAQLSADPSCVQDVPTNGVPMLRITGLGPTLKAGEVHLVELAANPSWPSSAFVTGVWMSHGSVSAGAKPNVFKLRASGPPRAITIRCFATFTNNFVAVQTRQVRLTKDG
jgi:hypothetical protein